MFVFFFFKQKTAYELRISDWSSECALPIFTAIAGLCLAFFLPITRPSKFGAVASGERASRHQQVGRSTAVLAFALLYGEGTDTHESGSDRDSVRPFGRALWIHYLPPGARRLGR